MSGSPLCSIIMAAAFEQQSFDDLGTHLSAVTFCVVDLETTGAAETDKITEIGAVKVRGGEVLGEFQTLVNPTIAIPPLIAVLTGITNAMVAGAPEPAPGAALVLAFAQNTVLVAHNAPFDVGFLRRACEALGYPFPRWPVVDTAALARQILLRDEVPNCRLATLAKHFRAATTPNHRALTDAQATVDVLHGLIERVGNLGVATIEDLREFTRKVSPQRRAKRTWADQAPAKPGVYLFVAEHADQRQVLYVGKSTNLRARVRSYFTAAEKRPRMEEMVRVATGVETDPLHDRPAGRGGGAAADRQPRPAIQPAVQVSRAHALDQDHQRGVPAALGGPGGPRRPGHLLRAVPSSAGGRGRAAGDLRQFPDPPVHAPAQPEAADPGLRPGGHGPLLRAMRRHHLPRRLRRDRRRSPQGAVQ